MQTDEQAIREVIVRWIWATKAGDLETVLDLMTEDVVFLRPGHPPMGKPMFRQAAEAQAGPSSPQFDGTHEIQEIQVLGDWAFVWAKLKVVMTPAEGEPITRAGHTLSIFKKVGGQWRLARDANMLAKVETET